MILPRVDPSRIVIIVIIIIRFDSLIVYGFSFTFFLSRNFSIVPLDPLNRRSYGRK